MYDRNASSSHRDRKFFDEEDLMTLEVTGREQSILRETLADDMVAAAEALVARPKGAVITGEEVTHLARIEDLAALYRKVIL